MKFQGSNQVIFRRGFSGARKVLVCCLLSIGVGSAMAQEAPISLSPLTPDQLEHQGVVNAVDVDSRSVVVNGRAYRVDVNTRFFQAGRRGPFQIFQPTDIRSLRGERIALQVDETGRVQSVIRLEAVRSEQGS